MATFTIQIERWNDTGMVLVRSRASDAPETDKDVLRTIDYNVFEGTHIPIEYELSAGALVSLMLRFPERIVSLIELEALRDGDVCTATAHVKDGARVVYRSGFGDTPIEALASLAIEIQRY